jgi:hypothetical protein
LMRHSRIFACCSINSVNMTADIGAHPQQNIAQKRDR